MKKTILFLLLGCAFSIYAQDPVVMQVDNDKVTKSEFLQIYLKNNPNPQFDKATLDEYMLLFRKFKLKVAEAEDLGYDTIPKLKTELEGYQKQLAHPYLIDSAQNEALVLEAYERTKEEIRAAHILIRVDINALPKDTLEAYNRIIALRERILKGESFEEVAKSKQGSEDPSAQQNGGDLGYFTAFQMVYPFEDAAYRTSVGTISMPVRTRFGYHIIKVLDKRPARGTITASHIMVSLKRDASEDQVISAEKKIFEIYQKLKDGEAFETLAKQFSDDPGSSSNGGKLSPFGTGTTVRMVPEFEDAAFKLKNDGDYSEPVRTDYGFHIIRRLEWTGIPSFNEMERDLQNKVNRDERSKKTQDSFVNNLKKEYSYKNKTKKGLKWFNANVDSTYFTGEWTDDNRKSNKVLFCIDGKKYRQQEFGDYLENNWKSTKRERPEILVANKYKDWEKDQILELEKGKLASKHPEYKALMQEYHDGILLYEIMNDKVWNMAMKDTAGLRTFFESNRSNYMWKDRIDADVYECLNKQIADQVYEMLKNDTVNSKHVIEKINKDSELNLRVRMNKFEVENTSYLKDNLATGLNTPYQKEEKFYVVVVKEKIASGPKEFNEAKGIVTSDYQNHLEKEWIAELEKKHSVKVYDEVLYTLDK